MEKRIDKQVSREVKDEEFWNREMLKYSNRLRKISKKKVKIEKNSLSKKGKNENKRNDWILFIRLLVELTPKFN